MSGSSATNVFGSPGFNIGDLPPEFNAAFVSKAGYINADPIHEIQTSGLFRGHHAFAYLVLGRRAAFISTSVMHDVKEFGPASAAIPVLSTSNALEVVSNNVNDSASGGGARSVQVCYIDAASGLAYSNPIYLAGSAAIPAGFVASDILWMTVTEVGSASVAAGNIVLRVVGGPDVEQISAGGNRSLSARFTIPLGYTGYLVEWDGHAINADHDLRIRATVDCFTGALSSAYHFFDNAYLATNTNSLNSLPWLVVPSLARVKVSTIPGATGPTVRVDASFVLVLVKNQP